MVFLDLTFIGLFIAIIVAWLSLQFIIASRNPSNPKDWCQDFWRPDQFSAPKSPTENLIITYLIRVFDTTWESKFWALKFLYLGQFSIFHAYLKAIKAIEPIKKVLVVYLLRFLMNIVLKLMPWCQ